MSGADAAQTLLDQNAVIGIERHHIGDGAKGDQIEQLSEVGLAAMTLKPATPTQFSAGGDEQVEHDPNPGQVLAGEGTAWLIGVDQSGGLRQLGARQVMVGNQHRQAELAGALKPSVAGDAIVDGDDQIWPTFGGDIDDDGAEAVALGKAAWHKKIERTGAERAQAEYGHRGASRTIGIVIADDEQLALGLDVIGEQGGSGIDTKQLVHGVNGAEAMIQAAVEPAMAIEPREQVVEPVQRFVGPGWALDGAQLACGRCLRRGCALPRADSGAGRWVRSRHSLVRLA